MRIKKIQITNKFRKFYDLTIDLGDEPSKIVALIGANGCGKSCVLDAIMYRINADGQVGDGQGNIDYNYFSMDNEPYYYDGIIIDFEKDTYNNVMNRRKGNKKTEVLFRNSYRYNSNLNVRRLEAVAAIEENNIGASYTNDLDSKIEDNYKRLISYYDRYRKENKLTDEQAISNILGELNKILTKCLSIQICDLGDILGGNGKLYFKKNDQEKKFDFNVLSSGEKEVVDLLLDIYLRKDIYNDTIYIIDEPELHINTNIQRNLLIEIEKLIPDTCQLWIATHSIGFLRTIQKDLAEKSSIVVLEGNTSIEKCVIEPLIPTRKKWIELFETSLDDMTNLVAPEEIIYCEGRKDTNINGEPLGLDENIYNLIFEKNHPNTLFVSAGGCSEIDRYAEIGLMILRKSLPSVKFKILKDKDIKRDGLITTDNDRLKYLEEDSRNRMLKRKEIENYLFDFEILNRYNPKISRKEYDEIVSKENFDFKDNASEFKKLCLEDDKSMNLDSFKRKIAEYITPETTIYRELEECIFY